MGVDCDFIVMENAPWKSSLGLYYDGQCSGANMLTLTKAWKDHRKDNIELH